MKNLKQLRLQRKLTQQELADRLHISQQSIYKYEHNITSPDFETLKSIADYFDTSIDYLIGNTDFPRKLESLTESMLNSEELMLITNYRKLNSSQKDAFYKLLDEFTANK